MDQSPRIIIMPNGPYFVCGGVPLVGLDAEGKPGSLLHQRPVYGLCRCGVSTLMPICDGIHLQLEWDWTETADRGPTAERAAQVASPDGEVLRDDPSLCAGAGFCRRAETDVWSLIGAARMERPEGLLEEMVAHCPSGRLEYRPWSPPESGPPAAPQIVMVPDGPYWVQGFIPLASWKGEAYAPQERRALCRCGASRNKPFCDGAHQTGANTSG